MGLNPMTWFLLVFLVKGIYSKNVPSGGLTSLVGFCLPTVLSYRKNFPFQKIFQMVEQNFVLDSSRGYKQLIVNHLDSTTIHTKQLIILINLTNYRIFVVQLWGFMHIDKEKLPSCMYFCLLFYFKMFLKTPFSI